MTAISEARWQEAQRYEAAWWAEFRASRGPDNLAADIAAGHHFTAGVLDIRCETVGGLSVLDIAGGPYPIGTGWIGPKMGGLRWGLESYLVLDPGDYPEGCITRIRSIAEEYTGEGADEVWGYNVLQHVVDPAEVMATARACAEKRIRWFDVVETPIYPVHPHSIKADWLRAELSRDGFRIVQDIDGSRLVEGARQKWVALIAERT
jgi:hypothetical protein